MVWIISGAGLLVLLFLFWKTHGTAPVQSVRNAPLEEALPDYLASMAAVPLRRTPGKLQLHPGCIRSLNKNLHYLRSLPREELLPASGHLNDHGRMLQEEAAALFRFLKKRPAIPALTDGETRLGCFARVMFAHTNATLQPEGLEKAVTAWQQQSPFTVEELSLMPAALRHALLTLLTGLAEQCAGEQRIKQAAAQTLAALEERREKRAQKLFQTHRHNKLYLSSLLDAIRKAPEEDAAIWNRQLPLLYEQSAQQLAQDECSRQSESLRWVSHGVASLQHIGHMPWHRLAEQWDRCHALLETDPVYRQMDVESRAAYRRRAGEIGRMGLRSAHAVCDAALSLARNHEADDIRSHTGYYLLDDGLEQLLAALQLEKKQLLRLRLGIGSSRLYRFLAAIPAPALGLILLSSQVHPAAATAAALLGGLTAAQLLRALFCRITLPGIVPRLHLDRLPDEARTLVVCPAMLLDRQHALHLVRKLSILHKANPDPNLHYMLLGDFRDSMAGSLSNDGEIVATAAEAIGALQDEGVFFYLQRERIYHLPDHVHMSRERKYGGLETVMKLITGQPYDDSFAYTSVPLKQFSGQYRYMITLTEDTFMPPGTAVRMVGAMLHPLHRRRTSENGMRGVSVIQPAVRNDPAGNQTHLSRFLKLPAALDPFDTVQAAFDQRVLKTGVYHGNGIVDPKAYLSATHKQMIPGAILNRDFPEGLLGGCARAGDIVLTKDQPGQLQEMLHRLHRYTRGIWQLLPYVLDYLPGKFRPAMNSLRLQDRRRIRRALLSGLFQPLHLLTIVLCILLGEGWLLAAVLLLPVLLCLPGGAAGALLYLLYLPPYALTAADAIGRTLYRLFVSRQHLLEWIAPAELAHSNVAADIAGFYMSMAAAGGTALLCLLPGALRIPGIVLAAGFACAPFALPSLESPTASPCRPTDYMREVLLRLAKNTLLFFETAITPQDHGLPPDNVQIEPNKGISHHTSPAATGLYLCALIAAQMLDLLSADELAQRIRAAADAMERMPKWNGHLYSRYDTRTLQPYRPGIVSTTESGILAVCLATAAQGLRCLLPRLHPADSDLPEKLDHLAAGIRFAPLYDPRAELFHAGMETEKGKPTEAHCGLLADESRLASFFAVMTGQVPPQHWQRLERTRVRTGHGQSLLSRHGALADYLLPFLFQPLLPGSLLTETAGNAIRMQASIRQQGVWGISGSRYYAFDPQLYYCYKPSGPADLALDPDTEADVITPYAAALALPFAPKAAFRNLLKLQSLGLEGPLGLFEAADLNPARIGDKRPWQLVHCHTARHQGMILCSICNFLCEQGLANLFYRLPGVQAYRLLLEEPMQAQPGTVRDPLRQIRRKNDTPSLFTACKVQSLQFPLCTHILRGAGTTLAVNATGGGYISKNGLMLTRFEESCHLPSGIRFYLRDSRTGQYWQVTEPAAEVVFETAQAVFTLIRHDVESALRVFVDPLSGAAVHVLSVENRSEGQRMLEVCSYLEPSLLPHRAAADKAPETRKLGVYGAAIQRRAAEEDETTPSLWHQLSADIPMSVFHIQTNRLAFIGRGRTIYAPRELEMPLSGLADATGTMPEPCISLRGQFVLPQNGKARFVFVTHQPGAQESEAAFLLRCEQQGVALERYDAALTQALVTAQTLGLTPEVQRLLAPVCGLLCYTGQPGQNRRADGNTLPLSALAQTGISGSLPIAVWECSDREGLEGAELLIRMHAFCRMSGFLFDLALLCKADVPTSLYRSLREMVARSPDWESAGQSGGIHLFEPGKPAGEIRMLLFAAARLAMQDSDGALPEQLAAMQQPAQNRPVYHLKAPIAWQQTLPAMPEPLLLNGYGGFTREEGNYTILLPPGRQTPAPWCNRLTNHRFGTLAGESGLLLTRGHGAEPMPDNPEDTINPCGDENFYLRDEHHRFLWSLTRQPAGYGMSVRATHAPGETVYESSAFGICSRMHCFTDLEEPLALRVIHLRNEDTAERILTFCHSLIREDALCRISRTGNGFLMESPQQTGVFGSCLLDQDAAILSVMSTGTFHGLWGIAPAALTCGELPPSEGGNAALLCTTVQLKPGETRTLVCAVGQAEKRSELDRMFRQVRSDGATRRLHSVKQYWEHRLSSLHFDLPDEELCLLLNRWLPYQIETGLLWHGSTEAARDHLGCIPALVHTDPGYVRNTLLHCAAAQDRSRAAVLTGDDLLLLPYMTALYVHTSGDRSILEEPLPLPREKQTEPDIQAAPAPSGEAAPTETLLTLCLNLLRQTSEGAHGLPEATDRFLCTPVENVWLGMLLCETLRRFAPLCPSDIRAALLVRREQLLQRIDRCAWDGGWYLHGWQRDGTPLGSREADQCRISLLPQIWAVLCGASRDRCQSAIENVWRQLYRNNTGILRLFSPPFADSAATVAESPPGMGCNGGQVTGTLPWAIAALHQLGQEERAWELALRMLPTRQTAVRQMALRYRGEPYVLPAQISDHPRQQGAACGGWDHCGAAWYMAVITEQLLGFSKTGNRLRLRPVLPAGWDEICLTYRYGSTTYRLHASRSCTIAVSDGEPLPEGTLVLTDDGRIHEAVFPVR